MAIKNIEAASLYRLFLRGLYNGDGDTVNFINNFIDSGIDKAVDSYVADKRTHAQKTNSNPEVVTEEVDGTTNKKCEIIIDSITKFINNDSSGVIRNIIGVKFANFIAKLKTDKEVAKTAITAFEKTTAKLNELRNDSVDCMSIMLDFLTEIELMDKSTSNALKSTLPQPKQESKPQPHKEQPRVAHDLRQQKPQGFDVGNFVQQPNPDDVPVGQIKQEVKPVEAPKQYEGMNFNEKVEYVQKRINFIPKTHPKVGESWFDALITLIIDPFIQSTLTNLGAVKNPRFYEVKTYDSEHGKYDIAFNVNCTNDDNRIIVRYSTKLTQQANGTLGYSFDAKVVAKK